MNPADRFKRGWDDLARQNARYHIATSAWQTEEEFDRSGERDVVQFFGGIESLLASGAVVLDVGCGIGRMDRHVASRVRRLVGIDISGEMVRQARERLRGVPNVEFIEGDGSTLAPLEDGRFDLVFSYIVFQHISDATFESYVRECARVLHPRGHFVFQLVEARAAPTAADDTVVFRTRFHSEQHVRATLDSAGFTVESVARGPVWTDVVPCNFVRYVARLVGARY